MPSKQVLKDIQRLGGKKGRVESGLFIAEGPKIVSELIAAKPAIVEAVFALPAWIKAHGAMVSVDQLHEVSEQELERISQLQTPNEVLLVARQWPGSRPVAIDGWTIYLDTIQDPGNLGTIIRIADWFGLKHVVCSAGCAELFNPKVVQSTMASMAHINVWYDEAGDWLQEQHLPVVAAALNGKSIFDYDGKEGGILIIGNESKGIRTELLEKVSSRITIPRLGQAESLNAAVATGILLSHLT
jgi:TrmH family RNA methyltransferase